MNSENPPKPTFSFISENPISTFCFIIVLTVLFLVFMGLYIRTPACAAIANSAKKLYNNQEEFEENNSIDLQE